MAKKGINPEGRAKAGPYSHAVVTGNLVFLAGKTGVDASGKLAEGGITGQTRQTFRNLHVAVDEVTRAVPRTAGLKRDRPSDRVVGHRHTRSSPHSGTGTKLWSDWMW